MPEVSIVVPSYRQAKSIAATLASLIDQDFPDLEIIVVDSSSDNTTEIIRDYAGRYPQKIRLIEIPTQQPPGTQRNIGIENCSSPYVFFSDTDCILPPTWVSHLLPWIRKKEGLISGAIDNGNPKSLVGWVSYWTEFSSFMPGLPARANTFIPTAGMAGPREKFLKSGGFTQALHGEDMQFVSKWIKEGGSTLFDPSQSLKHLNRIHLGEVFRHQFKLGKGSAIARRAARAGMVPVNAFFLWPFLGLIRYLLISRRVLWARSRVFLFLGLSPLIILVLIAWNWGFICGSLAGRKGLGTND